MKIGILGCGAIGSVFLGYLKQNNYNVQAVVREYQKEPLLTKGLIIERDNQTIEVKELVVDTHLSQPVDLGIIATKVGQLREVVESNLYFLKEAVVLTTQNGIGTELILKDYFKEERIISGIVMFGATFYPPQKVVYNFKGELVLGNFFGKEVDNLDEIEDVLKVVTDVFYLKNIKGAKYLKVLINLNNSISGCLGISMQEAFSDERISALAVELLKEAYRVIKSAGIELESLPTYPKERIETLVSLPTKEAAKIFSQIMQRLSDRPLYGSILQSIQKGKKSEVDYINGAIVYLAKSNSLEAPLNEKILKMVHCVEESHSFLNKDNFLKEIAMSPTER